MGLSYSSCNGNLYMDNEMAFSIINNEATKIMNQIICQDCSQRENFSMQIGCQKINELHDLFNECQLIYIANKLGISTCSGNKKRIAVDIVNFYLDTVSKHVQTYTYLPNTNYVNSPSNVSRNFNPPCNSPPPCDLPVVSPCNIYDELYEKINTESNNTQALLDMYEKMKNFNEAIRNRYDSLSEGLMVTNAQPNTPVPSSLDLPDISDVSSVTVPFSQYSDSNFQMDGGDNFGSNGDNNLGYNSFGDNNFGDNLSNDARLAMLEKQVEAESLDISSTPTSFSSRNFDLMSSDDLPLRRTTTTRTTSSTPIIPTKTVTTHTTSTNPLTPSKTTTTHTTSTNPLTPSKTTTTHTTSMNPLTPARTTTTHTTSINPLNPLVPNKTVTTHTTSTNPLNPLTPSKTTTTHTTSPARVNPLSPVVTHTTQSSTNALTSKVTTSSEMKMPEDVVHTVVREVPVTHRTIYKPVIVKREVINEKLPVEPSPRISPMIVKQEVAQPASHTHTHTHTHTETIVPVKQPAPVIPIPPATPVVSHITHVTPGQKTIRMRGETVKHENGRVTVTNPKSVEVTQTIHKSQLGEFHRSLHPDTKVVKIEPAVTRTSITPAVVSTPVVTPSIVSSPIVSPSVVTRQVISTPVVTSPIIPSSVVSPLPVRAVANHNPTSPTEVPLVAGQTTSYLRQGARGWAYVRHPDGTQGYVPSSHLSL